MTELSLKAIKEAKDLLGWSPGEIRLVIFGNFFQLAVLVILFGGVSFVLLGGFFLGYSRSDNLYYIGGMALVIAFDIFLVFFLYLASKTILNVARLAKEATVLRPNE